MARVAVWFCFFAVLITTVAVALAQDPKQREADDRTTGSANVTASDSSADSPAGEHSSSPTALRPSAYWSSIFAFMLATFIGIGVIARVSRLLHTPLMSLTNAISAIAVVGAIIVTGSSHYSLGIRVLGAIALFASMTNIVSGFLITDRMLKMFKQPSGGGKP
jgi:NAD(P) transhydrogenase subunit alpha